MTVIQIFGRFGSVSYRKTESEPSFGFPHTHVFTILSDIASTNNCEESISVAGTAKLISASALFDMMIK